MKVSYLHDWQVTTEEARRIQAELARLASRQNEVGVVRLIAGVDLSAPNAQGIARGAVIVLSYPELQVMELQVTEKKPAFPYIPGLLSFREAPLILAACEQLKAVPDLFLVDGQGIAHPRRFGLASHLGLLLDTPTIGCAKSRLCGEHGPVGAEPGSWAELKDKGEVIGTALRTKKGAAPLYVSIGHKIELATAISWVLRCCRGQRLPEPTRLAHLAAGGRLTATP